MESKSSAPLLARCLAGDASLGSRRMVIRDWWWVAIVASPHPPWWRPAAEGPDLRACRRRRLVLHPVPDEEHVHPVHSVATRRVQRLSSPPPMPPPVPHSPTRWIRTRWFGWMAVLLLLVGTPGTAEVAEELILLGAGVVCCEDEGCGSESSACCLADGLHCACCAQMNVLPGEMARLPTGVAPCILGLEGGRPDALLAGHRSPPFRPPAA